MTLERTTDNGRWRRKVKGYHDRGLLILMVCVRRRQSGPWDNEVNSMDNENCSAIFGTTAAQQCQGHLCKFRCCSPTRPGKSPPTMPSDGTYPRRLTDEEKRAENAHIGHRQISVNSAALGNWLRVRCQSLYTRCK